MEGFLEGNPQGTTPSPPDDPWAAALGGPTDPLGRPPAAYPPSADARLIAGVGSALAGAGRAALQGLWDTIKVPGDVLAGRYAPEDIPALARQTSFNLAALGSGLPGPGGALRMFGGVNAKTADLVALRSAQEMEAGGKTALFSTKTGKTLQVVDDPAQAEALAARHSPGLDYAPVTKRDIWDQTGWFRGEDGQWRFEIPDTGAKWKPDLPTLGGGGSAADHAYFPVMVKGPRLGQVLDHPELFRAYPELADMPVQGPFPGSSIAGGYDATRGLLYVSRSSQRDALSIALHEIQHAVQGREGFSPGGSSQEFLPEGFGDKFKAASKELEAARGAIKEHGSTPDTVHAGLDATSRLPLDQIPAYQREAIGRVPIPVLRRYQDSFNAWQKLQSQRVEAYTQYRNISGEVEARNVEERHATGDYSSPPWEISEHPPGTQLVKPIGPPGPFPAGGPLVRSQSGALHLLHPVDHNPFGDPTP